MRAAIIGLVTLSHCVAAIAASPQYMVALSGDRQQLSCIVPGDGSGEEVKLHIFVIVDQPVTALQVALYPPACWAGAVFIGDALAGSFAYRGPSNGPEGMEIIAYSPFPGQECTSLPLYIGYVEYTGVTASSCCEVRLSKPTFPIPYWPEGASAMMIDCAGIVRGASTTSVFLNASASCPCQATVATETTTWGRIKSLYR